MQHTVEFIQSYPDIAQLIGVIGFMIYIGNFCAVQSGHICGNGILFPILQVIAASFVLISLASAYNLASFMIQTSYIAIGLFGITLRLRKFRTNRPRPANRPEHPGPDAPRARPRPRQEKSPAPSADCHEPATLFRHSAGQSGSQPSHSLCP